MGDGLKADVGPGGQREDGEGAVKCSLLPGKRRIKGLRYVCAKRGHGEANHHAREEQHGHYDLRAGGGFAAQTHQRGQHQRADGQQDFPEIDMEAGNFIIKAELEGASEQRASNQRQGRSVGPDDRDIGQDQEPGAQEAMVITEASLRIGIGTARVREPVHQKMIVGGDDQDDHRAEPQADCGPDRAGQRQEGGSRHDKGTPAHAAAKGQRPGAEGAQVRGPFSVSALIRQVVHHRYPSF